MTALTVDDLQSWLRISAAARLLGRSEPEVRRLIGLGRIETVRTPLGRLVDPACVERLIAQRSSAPKDRE